MGLVRRKSIDDVLGHHNPDEVVYNQCKIMVFLVVYGLRRLD